MKLLFIFALFAVLLISPGCKTLESNQGARVLAKITVRRIVAKAVKKNESLGPRFVKVGEALENIPDLKPESLKAAVYAAIAWDELAPQDAADIKDVLDLAYLFYSDVYAKNPESFESAEALRRIAVSLGGVFKDGAAMGRPVALRTPKGVVVIE